MQVSKIKLNKNIAHQTYAVFYQTMADLHSSKETEAFLKDFLTEIELITLAKRLMIALYLEKGYSYALIKKNLKVSSATIANVDKMMKKGSSGFALALKKIDADEWAQNLTAKISGFVSKIIGK